MTARLKMIQAKIQCKYLTDHTMSIKSEINIVEFHQSKGKWLTLGEH